MTRKFYHPQSILLLVISFVLFFSWKKEEQTNSDFKTELKFQVAEAKLWFTNNPVQKKVKSIASKTDGTNKIKKYNDYSAKPKHKNK